MIGNVNHFLAKEKEKSYNAHWKEKRDEWEKQFSLSKIRSKAPSAHRQANSRRRRIDRDDERSSDSGGKGVSFLSSETEGRVQGKGNLVMEEV